MYKLAPTVQDFSICLRCQYRLSFSKLLPSYRTFPPIKTRQSRPFTSKHRLRQPSARESGYLPNAYQVEGQDVIRYEVTSKKLDSHINRDILRARRDALGLEVLGKPAEVLVLETKPKDVHSGRFYPNAPDKNPSTSVQLNPTQMLEEIDAQRETVSTEQLMKNIEDVRGFISGIGEHLSGPVSDTAFDGLLSELQSGFTTNQLAMYLEREGKNLIVNALDLHHEFSSSVFARSSWREGSTPLTEVRAPTITPHGEASTGDYHTFNRRAKKELLAERVLRQCWQVRPKREEALMGELDIRVEPIHLDVIINHNRDILKKISESYGVKLEVSRQDQLIRLSSDFDTCADMLRLFVYLFNNICCGKIEISRRQLRNMGRQTEKIIYAQAENLTSTVIKSAPTATTKSATEVLVYYLGPDTADFEDAQRYIARATGAETVQERKFFFSVKPAKSSIVSSPVDVGTNFSMKDRTTQWSRWHSTTISQKATAHRDASPISRSQRLGSIFREASKFLTEEKAVYDHHEMPSSIERNWGPILVPDSSILLGEVLFPTIQAQKAEEKRSYGTTESSEFGVFLRSMANSRREILTSVAGMVRSLDSLGLGKAEDTRESLQIRMCPSLSGASSALLDALPDLEISVNLDNSTQQVSIKKARLVVEAKEVDVLLPDKVMDLRLRRKLHIYTEEIDDALEHFIRSSNLNVWGPERLKTPSSLRLTIPAHAVRSFEKFDQSLFNKGLVVDYSFTSLEHVSRITMPYTETAHVNYTVVEAGKAGGRREETTISYGSKEVAREKHLANKRMEGLEGGKLGEELDEGNTGLLSLWNAAHRLIGDFQSSSPGNFRDGKHGGK